MGTKAKTAKKKMTAADRLLPKGRVFGNYPLPAWAIKAGRLLLKKVPRATSLVFEDSWVYAIEPRKDGSGYVHNPIGVRYEVHEMSIYSLKSELIENYCDDNPTEEDAIGYASLCAETAQEIAMQDGTYKSANLPRTIITRDVVMQGSVDYTNTKSSVAA